MAISESEQQLPLAVSIGDPAGIGVDVILAAWAAQRSGSIEKLPSFVLICDPNHLTERALSLNLDIELEHASQRSNLAEPVNQAAIQVIPLSNSLSASPGKPEAADADGVVEAITTAVEMTKSKRVCGVVTLPINKKSLYDAGFKYPGHTEFLGVLSGSFNETTKTYRPIMMLAGPELRAVPVTIHIPLNEVAAALNVESIVETISITARDLQNRFGIARPRIAVSGLNPHAGEEGAMGREDIDIILPAIEHLKAMGIDCFGPLPADTMFHKSARSTYDAAVCMYHDQALIPAKALAFDETVNVTLGLPFVRTSPDHGTAYDIAGTGKANPASTIAALRLADKMTRGFTK